MRRLLTLLKFTPVSLFTQQSDFWELGFKICETRSWRYEQNNKQYFKKPAKPDNVC